METIKTAQSAVDLFYNRGTDTINDDVKMMVNKHRWVLISLATMGIFLIALFSQIVPKLQAVSEMSDSIKGIQYKISLAATSELSTGDIKKHIESLQTQIDALILRQNQETQLSRILKLLHEASQEHHIRILTIKPQAVKGYDRHAKLPVELTLIGQYHDVGRFLNSIETAALLAKVQFLSMQSENMISRVLTVHINLVFYYLKPT